MEFLKNCIDFFIHIDTHLSSVIHIYGMWTYVLVALIIFCETGLVITPFLPGDSLLFVLGAFAAHGDLDLMWLFIILVSAAILGNTSNYCIGHFLAPKIFRQEKIPFIKEEYLKRTESFFTKYGGKTIIISRFMPIIRTMAPFLAGVGSMSSQRFLAYNIIGGLLWVSSFLFAGYFFGNLPFIKKNFIFVVYLIICISLIPFVMGYFKQRRAEKH